VQEDLIDELLYVVGKDSDVTFDMPWVYHALPISVRDTVPSEEFVIGIQCDQLLLYRCKAL
jgi:hypothetical protein